MKFKNNSSSVTFDACFLSFPGLMLALQTPGQGEGGCGQQLGSLFGACRL